MEDFFLQLFDVNFNIISILKELDRAPEDDEVLPQGSMFNDHVVLPSAEERRFIK